jgi:hypothetical protein
LLLDAPLRSIAERLNRLRTERQKQLKVAAAAFRALEAKAVDSRHIAGPNREHVRAERRTVIASAASDAKVTLI